jgi:capsular exopolysaccharide synthesis family protein
MDDAVGLMGDVSREMLSRTRVIAVQPNKRSRLVFLTDPTGLAVEQYRLLRRRLCGQHPGGGVILITSPSPGEGKTLTSINLAWCLADSGQNTCLVDLDFRAPGVGPTLGYSFDGEGTEDVLTGKRTVPQTLRRIGERSLYVLGVRQRMTSPANLLASSTLTPLIDELRTRFQWVVLDLAPAIPMADVAEVVPHVDGALLVVRSGKTEKSLIPAPLEILGAKLWGVVLNDTPIDGSSYYGYYGNRKEKQR